MILFELPDDEEQWPGWIDAHLVSPSLRKLATEIAAVHDLPTRFTVPGRAEMEGWLGDRLPELLDRGTVALDDDRLGKLLADPRLLYGLQELVLVEGGAYWSQLAAAKTDPSSVAAARKIVDKVFADAGSSSSAAVADGAAASRLTVTVEKSGPTPPPPSRPTSSTSLPRYLAALAASLAVAIGAWSLTRPAAPWGWNRADALADAGDAAAYLERLADSAGEWSAARPTTEARLRIRLDELLAGCDRLIAAPHGALSEGDRVWLVERCTTWRGKIEGHRDALARTHEVDAVRREANDTVAKLIKALRAQAADIRARPATPALDG